MYKWNKLIQIVIDEIDKSIKDHKNEELTLNSISNKLGYSEFYLTNKFNEISSINFKEYLRLRKLSFALKDVRDTKKKIIDIAFDYGFSSHEAFTRAFEELYNISPTEYRNNPKPVILRTKITAFDRYLFGLDEIGMYKSNKDVKIYFITIPSHKFLHIKNYESNGYWDFWQKQNLIEGQDYETVCGILDSIKGKLDDNGGNEINCSSGQIMGYINDEKGRLCDWGIKRTECWGVRLPFDYNKEIPKQMHLLDVYESDYVVFEYGAFDYDEENNTVEKKIEEAMKNFNDKNYCIDTAPNRIMYFYYNPNQYFKYIRPVIKKSL